MKKNIKPSMFINYKVENKDDTDKNLNAKDFAAETELQLIKRNLQTTTEDFLVYNEELISANEELQSMNDELFTINTQYQKNAKELSELNNDMTNYLYSTDIGTVFLDEKLCIKKFTPSITKELNIKIQDIGRPMTDITSNFVNDKLNITAREVMSRNIASEEEIQSNNGMWYLLKCVPYSIIDNIIKGVVISIIDITRSKNAEIDALSIKEKYERLVENSPYSIYIIQDNKFCFSNSAGLRLLNINDLNELLSIEYGHYFNIDEEKLFENGDTPKDDKIDLPNGCSLLVEISAMPLVFYGKDAKLLFVKNTSYKLKERQLEEINERNTKLLNEKILSENLMKEFFGNLSHEMRTPLNVFFSALQLLEATIVQGNYVDKENKITKYIKVMKQNCYRQMRLINNMIDTTKIDAGFFDLNLKNSNIINIVKNVTLSVLEYTSNKAIDLTFESNVDKWIISCDAEKIERVLLNLLSNSIKFTDSGGKINVCVYEQRKNILISIKDTGIGIPLDKLDIIFDRFRQVDKSTTRNQEGVGLGLSIAKSIVELHNGKINVSSDFGKGTEFMIILPETLLPEEDVKHELYEVDFQKRLEKLHIEFSDIY